jgi:hypothetical protein
MRENWGERPVCARTDHNEGRLSAQPLLRLQRIVVLNNSHNKQLCGIRTVTVSQVNSSQSSFFFHWLYSPPWALASAFQFHNHFTDGGTPWASDQLVARPLPKHRTTQTQNKRIHISNIHALCGIRTHDPGFRASEDRSATVTRPALTTMNYFPLIHYNMINLSVRLASRLHIAAKWSVCPARLILCDTISRRTIEHLSRLHGCAHPVHNSNTGLPVLSVSTKLCLQSEKCK